jgi:regulation of enolase protein 1 (concanavalin A-like superfamily)
MKKHIHPFSGAAHWFSHFGPSAPYAFALAVVLVIGNVAALAQISIPNAGFTYTQDFNTLAISGTSNTAVPAGWAFFETSVNFTANTTYRAGDVSGAYFQVTYDTYSFGATGDSDRAFGTMTSTNQDSLNSTIGACFTNNIGATITSLTITYTGETWRVGSQNRQDGLVFQYNQNTTAINGAGTWTAFSALNYFNPGDPTVGGGSIRHSAVVSATISGLNIAPGNTFCFRWLNFNATAAAIGNPNQEDALGIDDFSLSNIVACDPPTFTLPTLTQPTCAIPTGTIVVNATGSGALEYSVNNGMNWQTSATFSGLTPGSYHIKVRLQANPTCEATYGSNPVVLNSPFTASTTADTWTGCVSTDWATPGNWADGSVPTAADDVTIPNVANDPVIMGSTAALARSVLVQAGAVLTINTTGSLTINNSAVHGLDNYGTVDNSGDIIVGNTTAFGNNNGVFQRNGALFSNNAGASLTINAAYTGILNAGTTNNTGTIVIGNTSSLIHDGIQTGGIFNNNIGGTININRTGGFGGINNSGTFTNAGGITIGDVAISSQDALENYGTFINAATGDISVDRGANGIWHIVGTFQNSGKITVGSIANTGTGILSLVPFTNNAGAEIHIDRAGSGIVSTNAFTNAGLIRMGENAPLAGSGIANVQGANAVFNNNAGGDISIKQTAVNGVQNDLNSTFNNNACATLTIFDNLSNSGSFTNAGLFTVNTTQTHTNSALTNNGIIAYPQGNPIPNVTNNEIVIAPTTANACDVISPAFSLGSPVDFTIMGIFTDEAATMSAGMYTTATNTFTPTTFLAEGVRTFYVKVMDGSGSCTRILPWQLTTQNCCPTVTAPTLTQPTCAMPTGTIVVNATGSGALEYSINNGSTWQSTNTYGGQAPGSYNIKVRLQANPTCEATYAGNPVVLNSPFTASTTADTWTGCVSTDWATPGNWADGSVPTAADDVTIPNVTNDPVIMNGTAAVAKSVVVQAGAVLTINAMGSLAINNSAVHGLDNFGTVDNSGSIIVGNTTAIGAIGIVHRNGGAFNNKPGGYIQIDRALGQQAFYSIGLVNNEGAIEIGSNAAVSGEGIRLEGNTFNNKPGGSIQIDQTGSIGIRLLNNGTVLNNEALIEIGSQSDVRGNGIVNGGGCTFNNKAGGNVRINRIGVLGSNIVCIVNFGTFHNDAEITIGNIGLVRAQDGIQNASTGSFTNNATGIISISKPWGNGIWNSFGTFQNAGKITISDVFNSNTGNFSTGILSTGSFSNTAGAEIHLDAVAGGIANTNAFTNAGLIRMGENAPLTGSGIANVQGANAVFNNNAGGDISIKQTAVNGVQNDANSTFNNNACATLAIFDNLNNAGTFTNSGLFTVNTTQAHTNTALTNNGIISYPQGNPIPNVTNNEIIVAPTTANDCGPVSPAFGLGNSVDLTIVGIFTDEAATMSAGTYVTATNTFTPTATLAEGTYSLFVKIQDGNGGCTRIVPWTLTVQDNTPPSITCPATQTIVLGANCTATLPDYTGLATTGDNCGVQGVTQSPAIGATVSGAGNMTVTLTVTDVNGNSTACTFTVTKVDNTPPTVQCFNQTLSFNGESTLLLNADDLVDADDSCSETTITLSPTAISCEQVGQVVPVTITVTDVNGNPATCTSNITVGGLPCGWSQNPDGVGCTDGNNIAYNPATGVWTATSTNCFYGPGFTSDATAFAQRTLCGDGSITAQVTDINGTSLGWAGVVMRESNAGGAKKAQLMTNLSSFSRREFRTTTGGAAQPQQFPSQNRYWLRLVRAGDQFSMFVSPNGLAWYFVGAQNVPMNSCIQVGLVATNYQQTSTVTATFANVGFTGSNVPPMVELGIGQSAEGIEAPHGFEAYPNPTTGELNVDLGQYIGRNVRVEVYSLTGQLLRFVEIDEVQTVVEQLDLSAFQSGMYLVKVKSDGLPDVTRRVVLAR